MWFKKRKMMKLRFFKAILLIALLSCVITAFFLLANQKGHRLKGKICQHIEMLVIANDISSYAKRTEGHFFLYLMLNSKVDKEKFFERVSTLDKNILKLKNLKLTSEFDGIYNSIVKNSENILASGNDIIFEYEKQNKNKHFFEFEKIRNKIKKFHFSTSSIRKSGVELVNLSSKVLEEYENSVENENKYKFILLSVFISISIFFSVVIFRQSGIISVSARLTESLQELSYIDSLTEVGNRRKFDEEIEKEWKRALRGEEPLSLILIDIDHFKLFNDHYGHAQGDECLKTVAQTLKKCLKRPTDTLARYGGEELVDSIRKCTTRNTG
jgi:Diguanylate cyclase, GGDEF domain